MKLAGTLFLVAGTGGYGFYMAGQITKRLQQLQELYQLLLMLQGEIRYQNALLEEAFGAMAGRLDGWRHHFLQNLCRNIAAGTGQALEVLWRQEAEKLLDDTCLNANDIQLLLELGGQIGYLDRSMQVTTIEFYKNRLSGIIEEAEQKKEGQCRLYRVLGLAGGTLAALVLL